MLQIRNRVTKHKICYPFNYKIVIKHVTIIKTKMCGLSVACVLDPVMSGRQQGVALYRAWSVRWYGTYVRSPPPHRGLATVRTFSTLRPSAAQLGLYVRTASSAPSGPQVPCRTQTSCCTDNN